jgi:hypothetical protein
MTPRLVEYLAYLSPGRPVSVTVPENLTDAEAAGIVRAVHRLLVLADTRGWAVRPCELSGPDT